MTNPFSIIFGLIFEQFLFFINVVIFCSLLPLEGVDSSGSCWKGHFIKLLYEDFEVYIEQIVVRSEEWCEHHD